MRKAAALVIVLLLFGFWFYGSYNSGRGNYYSSYSNYGSYYGYSHSYHYPVNSYYNYRPYGYGYFRW